MDYNKCVVRKNAHLVNRLKIENKYLRYEHNSTKIRQMNKFVLRAIKSYLAKENFCLWEIQLLKNPVCFDNVCKEIAPVVPEIFLQKRINTVIKITELEQSQHEQICNNSEITQWAENCNKLKTETVTFEKKELFSLIIHLIGQLNEKSEIINNIVSDADNIRCKLVDETKKLIEKDNRIKEITLETCQLRKENEKARVKMIEFVKNCNKVLNSSEEQLKIQGLEIFKRTNDDIRHDAEIKEYKNMILELEFEIKYYNELHQKLNIKHDELQRKYDRLKVKCYHDSDTNGSNANTINSKIITFKQIDISGSLLDCQIAELKQKLTQSDNELCECVQQKNDAQSKLTLLNKSHSKLSAEFDELNNKHQTLKTQFDELTKTNHKMDKLWTYKLNSANKKTKIKEAELIRTITQLKKDLSDLKITKNQAKNVGLTKLNSNLRPLQSSKKVITSNEPIAIRDRKQVSKIVPDIENKKSTVGNDAESNILLLQAEGNLIKDTAEKEKEMSEENSKLIKERKQSSNPSEIPIKLKAKPVKEIIATPSIVNKQTKVNSQCYPKVSNPKKPVQKNANLLRKPFR